MKSDAAIAIGKKAVADNLPSLYMSTAALRTTSHKTHPIPKKIVLIGRAS
jgi:hypothetical protein